MSHNSCLAYQVLEHVKTFKNVLLWSKRKYFCELYITTLFCSFLVELQFAHRLRSFFVFRERLKVLFFRRRFRLKLTVVLRESVIILHPSFWRAARGAIKQGEIYCPGSVDIPNQNGRTGTVYLSTCTNSLQQSNSQKLH